MSVSNPEIRQAFEYNKACSKRGGRFATATDPDCDRMGIAVFDGNDYQLMTGNEVGAMFAQYVLSQYTQKDKMPKNPIVVKSIVTTKLVEEIAKNLGENSKFNDRI